MTTQRARCDRCGIERTVNPSRNPTGLCDSCYPRHLGIRPRSTNQALADAPREWTLRAACRDTDPEIFYPAEADDAGPAIAICATCPVRAECAAYATATGQDYGVWGGRLLAQTTQGKASQ